MRKTLETEFGHIEWTLQQAWTPFIEHDAICANQNFDAIVIGGGGLLLKTKKVVIYQTVVGSGTVL